MTPDDIKLRELILYVAQRSEEDFHFGKTKLYKILFFADFGAYARWGRSITGHPYERYPKGPVPARGPALLEFMEERGDAQIVEETHYDRPILRVRALRPAALDVFSAEELGLVEHVVRALRDDNAKQVSERSHEFIGWQATLPGEVIPYETVFVDAGPLTPDEEAWCRELVAAGR